MDIYGIGPAIESCAIVYFNTSRHSGRTHHMLSLLKPGDRIIFSDFREASRVQNLLYKEEVKANLAGTISICVIPPDKRHEIGHLPVIEGKTWFDHLWVEQLYRDAINHATSNYRDLNLYLNGTAKHTVHEDLTYRRNYEYHPSDKDGT